MTPTGRREITNINGLSPEDPTSPVIIFQGVARQGSNEEAGSENENPGALAGATGADLEDFLNAIDNNLKRESAARTLMEAVLACDPQDRITLMECFIEALRQGDPVPPFMGIMASARDWAAWACRAELKAYCLASFEAMSGRDQAAFLGHVGGRAAA